MSVFCWQQRAGVPWQERKTAKEDDDNEIDPKSEDEDNDDSDGGTSKKRANTAGARGSGCARLGSSSGLRAQRLRVEAAFTEGRGLQMEAGTLVYSPETIYGARKGKHEFLMLVPEASQDNVFAKSDLFHRGVVTGVAMLPKAAMTKPPGVLSKASGLTIVQQHRCHTGGPAIPAAIFNGIYAGTKIGEMVTIVDLYGYDGSTALYAINRRSSSSAPKEKVATICHHADHAQHVKSTISQKLYEWGSKGGSIPGFPDLSTVTVAKFLPSLLSLLSCPCEHSLRVPGVFVQLQ